ncbi:MAG: radical SAM protein, partial [Myxococcota bacterium]
MSGTRTKSRVWNLVAEVTYRCPLRCPYCSNPVGLREFPERLDADEWGRVFREAATLGAVHCGLTGGEPTTRRDLPEIVRGASEAGLYTHLVTAALPIEADGLTTLREAGLRSVQVSVQDAEAKASDEIAGTTCFERKVAFAREVRAQGLPLTLNVVLHRRNLAR